MPYQVPNDYLQSQLIKAILANESKEVLDGIVTNFINGAITGEKPTCLGEDVSTEKGKKAFWQKFLNKKIKIYNSRFSTAYVKLSPIHIAARTGSVELMTYLMEKYPETDKTPLLSASIETHSLMDSDVLTIDESDYYGGSNALLLAITHGNIDTAKYLYNLNTSLGKQCDAELNTPLHWTTRLGYQNAIQLPNHENVNKHYQNPEKFAHQHYQQQALNSIREAKKQSAIQDLINLQNLLMSLEKNLHILDALIKELNPKDVDRKNKVAQLVNEIVTDIITAKLGGKTLTENQFSQYQTAIAKEILSLHSYDAASKKILIALATALAITVTILVTLTVFGIAAEIAGASFYAGFSAATSEAAILGGAVEVTTGAGTLTAIAGEGAASAAWFIGIPVSGAAGLYLSDRYARNQGQRTLAAIEDNLQKIQRAQVTLQR